ncbi:uncharacterized protein A4U43_C06F10610 [Asparagus officinalis]|uniref:DDT domain-containing protein n=1 Tax=Asparagus officinalis TaxID=4686 RepID=A0A5P1EKY0_ASPOF|nr:uncharacterized protein LOC109844476 [Asparagus officinalis]ONK66655.1 uncharacterized protein A4U43_C06F10610 [Asparagus officinalis]
MAVVENSDAEISQKSSPLSPSKKKRTKDPGVRVKGGRIYDSENGKTCHQCRQKTRDFAAFCKKLKNDKPCTLTFCHKCLLNRYGEKADEVAKLKNWICPRCRGVCNCSFCMKRKGCQPTGILSHTAKATGFNSVHELLHTEGAGDIAARVAELNATPKKSPLSNKGSPALKRNRDKENQRVEQNQVKPSKDGPEKKKAAKRLKCGEDETQMPVSADSGIIESRPTKSYKLKKDANDKEHKFSEADKMKHSSKNNDMGASQDKETVDDAKTKSLPKVQKLKKLAIKDQKEPKKEEIVLPLGSHFTEIAGIELPDKDIGAALQFLEFCNAFSEVLHIKKGQPENVLLDLNGARVKRNRVLTAHVDFNIKLLSLIEKDVKKDGDAWVQTLKRCIEESECKFEGFPLNVLDTGLSGYENLESSQKLKMLNFLCDEVLGTEELRNWIDEVAAKFDDGKKEYKEKVFVAKQKEKLLKQKVKDETAKAVLSARGGNPLSLAEFDSLLSKLRAEVEKVRTKVRESIELVPKKNQRFDAVRTDYLIRGNTGQVFWKLIGYNRRSNIILQDIGNVDSFTPYDKWFFYDEEQEKVAEKYVSTLRNPAIFSHPTLLKCRQDDDEGMKSDSSNSSEQMET